MDDPAQCTIRRLGASSLPIFLPWHREHKRILACFDSSAAELQNGPWKRASPFHLGAASSRICQARLEVGVGRAVEGRSDSNSLTSEHFSGTLGLSVGNSLLSAGVSASYDQQMQEATNASRASHNSRLRCGRVALASDPPLSSAAKSLLRRENGQQLFKELYGDYYVAGYVLGADAGGCLSATSSARQQVKTMSTTVRVKALWESYTSSTCSTESHQTYSMDLAFDAYDTLAGTNVSLRAKAGEKTDEIREAALLYAQRWQALHERLERRIHEMGLEDCSLGQVSEHLDMIKAGLVVELILTPFRALGEYSRYHTTPVGTALLLTDEELAVLSLNDLQEYRASEAIALQRFNSRWIRIDIDWPYHDEKERLEKLPDTDPKKKPALEKLQKKYNEQITAHNNKKAAAWTDVLEVLKRRKNIYVQTAKAVERTAAEMEADYRIPQAGRWISFPIWNMEEANDRFNGKPVPITWTASNTTFTATYYKTTCWFGKMVYDRVPGDALAGDSTEAAEEQRPIAEDEAIAEEKSAEDKSDELKPKKPPGGKSTTGPARANVKFPARSAAPTKTSPKKAPSSEAQNWKASARLEPFGETDLFIAAEFIEQRYQGAPHLRGFHLKDNSPAGTKWAYLLIDHALHYGQDAEPPTHRYLVYHPFIRPRNIPQKSFADNLNVAKLHKATTALVSSKSAPVSVGAAVADALVSIIEARNAHPLRRFPKFEGDQRLYNVPAQMADWEVQWNKQETALAPQISSLRKQLQLDRDLDNTLLADVLVDAAALESEEQAEKTAQDIADVLEGLARPVKKKDFIIKTNGRSRVIAADINARLEAENLRAQQQQQQQVAPNHGQQSISDMLKDGSRNAQKAIGAPENKELGTVVD
ncbi:uncharacterized protein J7T54_007389 [Emericellopsis cladophorae]|uniref:Uncharacterized protein n=1 Tax=Emericellopsis cladophorae TaxID=2686198 RepID=A0A9P9XZS1_9HYPO|nr:uncharacterized protein J7T54_007389 [Emericellopsis cladophorae]KAI6780909.1 hypothetical protein J7T54_007389 [Emericellopsis cladophorae]